jgi:hypothetical protein
VFYFFFFYQTCAGGLDFHFGVFLPESVRRIFVGGYSSDFICFLLLLKIQSEVLSGIWKLNFGKKFDLIITCSAIFSVQIPKCLGVGCAA